MMSMNFSDIAILSISGADYCCIISGISKSEALNIVRTLILVKIQNIIKDENLLSHIRMGKEILRFDDIEIQKDKFYQYKSPIFLEDVDIDKVLLCNKISFGEKKLEILYWLLE